MLKQKTKSFPLLEQLTLRLPHLPAELVGLRLLHLTDLHIKRHRRRYEQLLHLVRHTDHDLLLVTGDVMNEKGDEPVAFELFTQLIHAAQPRLGRFGVHGNHDTSEFRQRVKHLPLHWLTNGAFLHPALPLNLLGVDCVRGENNAPRGDLVSALLDEARQLRTLEPREGAAYVPAALRRSDARRVRILLAHVPNWLPAAAESQIDLVLSGHTHGGQIRLPFGGAIVNATPGWPPRLSSGIYQAGQTLAVISRGIGESYVDRLRFFCPPHVPLITLQPADAPLAPVTGIVCRQPW